MFLDLCRSLCRNLCREFEDLVRRTKDPTKVTTEDAPFSSADFPICCIAVLPACEPCECSGAPGVFDGGPIGKSAIQQVGKTCATLRATRKSWPAFPSGGRRART